MPKPGCKFCEAGSCPFPGHNGGAVAANPAQVDLSLIMEWLNAHSPGPHQFLPGPSGPPAPPPGASVPPTSIKPVDLPKPPDAPRPDPLLILVNIQEMMGGIAHVLCEIKAMMKDQVLTQQEAATKAKRAPRKPKEEKLDNG